MSHSGDTCKTAEHYTPKVWCDRARHVLGVIHMDPASCAEANKLVRAKCIYTREKNGLAHPWVGNVYVNAPGDARGVLVPRFWAKSLLHAEQGGVVLWAGFALDQMARLDPSPNQFAHVIIRRRIQWVPGEFAIQGGLPGIGADVSVSDGKSPTKHNFFCLLGGDRGQKLRFARRFGQFGAYRGVRR